MSAHYIAHRLTSDVRSVIQPPRVSAKAPATNEARIIDAKFNFTISLLVFRYKVTAVDICSLRTLITRGAANRSREGTWPRREDRPIANNRTSARSYSFVRFVACAQIFITSKHRHPRLMQ